MSTHNICFMENWQKLSFSYHQIPTLSLPLGVKMWNLWILWHVTNNILLQAMSDMTGVYSIVPKMPKAPDSLAERLLQDKQNITPPTPELLSDRLKKLAVSKGDNSKAPGQKWSTKWTSNEMPKPPKLLGNYSWMNNENKPPKWKWYSSAWFFVWQIQHIKSMYNLYE